MINFVNPPELSSPPGYSHVAEVRGGRLVYISGQIALDAQGKLVGKGDLEAQADQVFRNLAAALACGRLHGAQRREVHRLHARREGSRGLSPRA